MSVSEILFRATYFGTRIWFVISFYIPICLYMHVYISVNVCVCAQVSTSAYFIHYANSYILPISYQDLLIGWADSFRQLQLVQTVPRASPSQQMQYESSSTGIGHRNSPSTHAHASSAAKSIRARLVAEWLADSIICGISAFDKEHALVLGYIPVDEPEHSEAQHEELSTDLSDSVSEHSLAMTPTIGGDQDTQPRLMDTKAPMSTSTSPQACIELLLVQKKDGVVISADILPLLQDNAMDDNGVASRSSSTLSTDALNQNPESYSLLSTYASFTYRHHCQQWSVLHPHPRGGFRNLPPKLYILSPYDVVIVKVCDVNDRIALALQAGDIRGAVYMAKKDKYTLRTFSFQDLVRKFLTSLLDEDKPEEAAFECSQLIVELGTDPTNTIMHWEEWILSLIHI